MADDYSPVWQGDTGAPFAPQFQHADGSPLNLTGATITMKMVLVQALGDTIGVGSEQTCNPSNWTIDDAANGKAHYQWQSADVATPGVWNLYPVITINGAPVHADGGNGVPKQITILPAP